MAARIVHLDINEAGAWKRVASFDLDTFEEGTLEHCAESLLELTANKNLKARLIMPGDTAALMYWKHGDGWREWRAAA
jgi:hypothetical protein